MDISICEYGDDLKDTVLEQGRFGMIPPQVAIWKVCHGCLVLDFI